MLELAEGDVAATIEDLVVRQIDDIAAIPPHDWPWGEGTWFVAVAAARYQLAEAGVPARIGGGFEPQTADDKEAAIADTKDRLGIVDGGTDGEGDPATGDEDAAA